MISTKLQFIKHCEQAGMLVCCCNGYANYTSNPPVRLRPGMFLTVGDTTNTSDWLGIRFGGRRCLPKECLSEDCSHEQTCTLNINITKQLHC
jgi:hypothetical protein